MDAFLFLLKQWESWCVFKRIVMKTKGSLAKSDLLFETAEECLSKETKHLPETQGNVNSKKQVVNSWL
jgi:hypothetical protein